MPLSANRSKRPVAGHGRRSRGGRGRRQSSGRGVEGNAQKEPAGTADKVIRGPVRGDAQQIARLGAAPDRAVGMHRDALGMRKAGGAEVPSQNTRAAERGRIGLVILDLQGCQRAVTDRRYVVVVRVSPARKARAVGVPPAFTGSAGARWRATGRRRHRSARPPGPGGGRSRERPCGPGWSTRD